MKYRIICKSDPHVLAVEIDAYISAGWVLCGCPTVFVVDRKDTRFSQCIIKPEVPVVEMQRRK